MNKDLLPSLFFFAIFGIEERLNILKKHLMNGPSGNQLFSFSLES